MVKAQVINGEGELGQVECWNKRALYHVSPRERDPDYPPEPWSFIMSDWVGDENLSVAVVIQCRVQNCHSSEVEPKHLHGAGGCNLLLLTPSLGLGGMQFGKPHVRMDCTRGESSNPAPPQYPAGNPDATP